jgi:Type III secretion system translocator protein, HrpF
MSSVSLLQANGSDNWIRPNPTDSGSYGLDGGRIQSLEELIHQALREVMQGVWSSKPAIRSGFQAPGSSLSPSSPGANQADDNGDVQLSQSTPSSTPNTSEQDATVWTTPSTASDTNQAVQTTQAINNDPYAELDAYSQQNEQADLSQWSDLAASDQGSALERPLAAMQILSGQPNADGSQPTAAQTQAAMQFVNDNPSVKSALQNTGALKSDGTIDAGKMSSLLQSVRNNLSQADNNIKDYISKHPDADANSLATVRSAALLQAYDPIAGESTGHVDNGKNNGYGGGKNGGALTTKTQISDLQNNAGFSDALKHAAQAWSTSGAFDALDRSGVDKATNKADGMINDDNLSSFINSDAPSSQATDQSFLEDASLQNITANTDISKLNQDIFANPQNYTPQQKAAVMVKLMQTLVNVKAGGNDKLRNVDDTVAALTKDIQTLAADPATEAYLKKTVPPAVQSLNSTFLQAGGMDQNAGPGEELDGGHGADQSGQSSASGSDIADNVDHGMKAAKQVAEMLNDLAKGEGFMGVGGDSAAAETASIAAAEGTEGATAVAEGVSAGVEGVSAGVEGATAGVEAATAGVEAATGAIAGGLGALASVAGVGAVIAGIAGVVMMIVEAVQKGQNQAKFADNVNPTLQQFGIPLPK